MGLCLGGWLELDAQRKANYIETQATQTWIDALTMNYGKELSQLIENYEHQRRESPETPDLAAIVTNYYVLEYTETRCQAYAAVAINSQYIYNDYNSQPCGFCAVYVFVRAGSQDSWKFGDFLPIMGSAYDLARDWSVLEELGSYEGFIDVCPQWEPCPYWTCTDKK